MSPMLANLFYESAADGRTLWHAMPLLLGALCVLAIAYRYYSAFLAARVAALDDSRITPAHVFNDGQNYHPTNKWVLFGHHFAAISGAGPLIGPVLAIQYGFFPGLIWLVVGVCLAGAVQDMLVLAASVRRGGKSLAEIARTELGRTAAIVVSAAILFIVIIALAGLGIVVVKALGGETVGLPNGTRIQLLAEGQPTAQPGQAGVYEIPPRTRIVYPEQKGQQAGVERTEAFFVQVPKDSAALTVNGGAVALPAGTRLFIPGSSWGTFTIACTIPIALFVGLYMYRIRKGHVGEASLIGALAVLAATVAGSWIPESGLHHVFALSRDHTILALCGYGFVASVLPVWMLLCPRDYLSSFLKIGTIALLVLGLLLANPVLKMPAYNPEFAGGGPNMKGTLFPFLFICIMCGAISGFHALVASGTTPKMIAKESQVRPIGYGAMLMEGLVGIVALLAAAALDPVNTYFKINTDLADEPKYAAQFQELEKRLGAEPLTQAGVHEPHQLPVGERDLAELEQLVGGETLRGRTGGAVTLAVGMAVIFTDALRWTGLDVESVVKYWYHFAIMFEALFILTTIDTGTRIARFLLQEALGKVHPKFEQTDWLPGAVLATLVVTVGWGALVWSGSISTIWPMFGIANQLLAVVALALVTTLLVNTGKGRYAPVTILPMLFVISTTMTAGWVMVTQQFPGMIERGRELVEHGRPTEGNQMILSGVLSMAFAVFVISCVGMLLLLAGSRWAAVWQGVVPVRVDDVAEAEGSRKGEAEKPNGAVDEAPGRVEEANDVSS